MAQTLLRDKARLLRLEGLSLNEITSRLKAPKSTIRFWCKDIILSIDQQKRLFEKKRLGGIRAAEKIRKERVELTERIQIGALKEIGKISNRDLFVIGAALYWAEGYQKGDGEFGFTNSDPKMIQLIIRWLKNACGVSAENIHFRICINISQKHRLANVKRFWQKTLHVSKYNFSNPTLINVRNKKEFLNHNTYFGTLRVKVRKSTNLRRKIVGWINGLRMNA